MREFAQAMEMYMRLHDEEKGDSWKRVTEESQYQKLMEEFSELRSALADRESSEGVKQGHVCHEAIDLANVCMMVWNNNGRWL